MDVCHSAVCSGIANVPEKRRKAFWPRQLRGSKLSICFVDSDEVTRVLKEANSNEPLSNAHDGVNSVPKLGQQISGVLADLD